MVDKQTKREVAAVGITAILCLAWLESYALYKGIDGVLFAGVCLIIGSIAAGVGGFKIGKKFFSSAP